MTTACTVEEAYAAYQACRARKRMSATCIDYEHDLTGNLCSTVRAINEHRWRPDSHMCFVVLNPKPREVWASTFRDRVVHHIVYRRLRHRFEPRWIATSFACIEGRGTGAGLQWAQRAARSVTAGWTRPAWVLQLDIDTFFPTIDRAQILAMLLKRVDEPWLARLCEQIIHIDVTDNAHLPGNPYLLSLIPPHKSLWHAPDGKGLPIGNLTSQFAANVLLDVLDQRAVRDGWAAHYGRYVDDMLLLDVSAGRLVEAQGRVEEALADLGLRLAATKTRLARVEAGFDFCGVWVLPHRTYQRRSTVRRGMRAMRDLDGSERSAASVTARFASARRVDGWRLRGALSRRAVESGLQVDEDRTRCAVREADDDDGEGRGRPGGAGRGARRDAADQPAGAGGAGLASREGAASAVG